MVARDNTKRLEQPTSTPEEADMRKQQKLAVTLVVVAASFLPAAAANAGMVLSNHNETLLLDA
jgi:hypothetical protein